MSINQAEKIFNVMCEKAMNNIRLIKDELLEYPGCTDGKYFGERETRRKLAHIYCWTQSFFTGTALLAYENTKDDAILEICENYYDEYHSKVFDIPQDTMHDLGFLYSPYGVMLYRLTGDDKYKSLSVRAAEVLSHRFVPNGKYIRAWGRMDDSIPDYVDAELAKDQFFTKSKGLAIIDCMMNLPLLFWASEETGDVFYRDVAIAHADTTLENFIRDDGSVCHAYYFDSETGEPREEFNGCGYSLGSFWARGASWAIYGYAIAYRYTKKTRYRDAFLKLSEAFINKCGDNPLPVWDFSLPKDKPARQGGVAETWEEWDVTKEENTKYNIDASAACIAACGFLTFCEMEENDAMKDYTDRLLTVLCEEGIDTDTEINGMLKKTNGLMHYSAYGDYYAMEFIARCLGKTEFVW